MFHIGKEAGGRSRMKLLSLSKSTAVHLARRCSNVIRFYGALAFGWASSVSVVRQGRQIYDHQPMSIRIAILVTCAAGAATASLSSYAEEQDAAAGAEEPAYIVQCEEEAKSATRCTVDKDTYIGWRTYHSSCSHCHAQEAVGSTFTPSLVSGPAKTAGYAKFKDTVNNGYQGQLGVMPGYKDNPNIKDKIDNIYKFLKARADGELPPGRPTRMKK